MAKTERKIKNIVYQISKTNPIYRKADPSDIPQIKTVMAQTFGLHPDLESFFSKWILQPEYSVYVAELNQDIIGVCTCAIKQDADFSKYSCFGEEALRRLYNKKVASVVNLTVRPEYRGLKIGTQLAHTHLDWLEKHKCDVVLGTSWVNGTDQNSSHLYENAGFQKVAESTEFLRKQLPVGSMCNVCQSNECRCNSILYIADAQSMIAQMRNSKKAQNLAHR